MAVLDQSNTTTNGAAIMRRSDTNVNNRWGQNFLVGTKGSLDSIAISLSKTGSPTGTLTVQLFADSSDTSPTGSALSSSSTNLDVSTVSTTQTEYTFNFPNDFIVNSGTKYWFVVTATYTQSLVNYINIWQNNAGDAYTNGHCNRADDTTWQNDQGTNDLYFKDFINAVSEFTGGYMKPMGFWGN